MYPTLGPIRCVSCGEEIPGTDLFWTMHHVSHCGVCEGKLNEDERKALDTKRSTHNEILRDVVSLGTGQPAPTDPKELSGIAQRLVVARIAQRHEEQHRDFR